MTRVRRSRSRHVFGGNQRTKTRAGRRPLGFERMENRYLLTGLGSGTFFNPPPFVAGDEVEVIYGYLPIGGGFNNTADVTAVWQGPGMTLNDHNNAHAAYLGVGSDDEAAVSVDRTFGATDPDTGDFIPAGNWTVNVTVVDTTPDGSQSQELTGSTQFTVLPMHAPAFSQQPTDSVRGQPVQSAGLGSTGPVVVEVRNDDGSPDTNFKGTITLTGTNNVTGASVPLSNNTATSVGGFATFTNLTVNTNEDQADTHFHKGMTLTPTISSGDDVANDQFPAGPASSQFVVGPHGVDFVEGLSNVAAGQSQQVVQTTVAIGGPPSATTAEGIDKGYNAQVAFTLRNSSGNPLANGAQFEDATGKLLGTTLDVQATGGIADFGSAQFPPDMRINTPGSYTLLATLTGDPSFGGQLSPVFNITGHTLKFNAQPSSGTSGDALDAKVEVDSGGTPDTTFAGTVQLTLADQNGNPVTNGASLVDDKGNALAGLTLNATSGTGIADFNDIRINKAGTYTLIGSIPAEAGATPSITSSNFTLNPHTVSLVLPAGFGGAPGEVLPDFQIKVFNANGLDANFNGTATLSLNTVPNTPGGGGDLTLDSIDIQNGQATAHLVGITLSGTYTITATLVTDGGSGTSSQFTVQRTIKVIQGPPSIGTVNEPLGAPILANGAATTPVEIEVLAGDPANNTPDTQFIGTVTITDAAGNVVNGTAPVSQNALGTAQPGVAIFNTLSINSVSNNNQLTATIDGDTVSKQNPLAVGSVKIVPHTLVFEVAPPQPGVDTPDHETTADILKGFPVGGLHNASSLQPLQVAALDANADIDPTFQGSITLGFAATGNPGGATLTGNSQAATKGEATFNNLTINKPGTGYLLTAAGDASVPPTVIGSPFNVVEDTLQFEESGRTIIGALLEKLTTPIVVDVLNPQDAIDTGFTGQVTLALASAPFGVPPGDFTGASTTKVNAVAGVATFNNLAFNFQLGDYTFKASLSDGTKTSNPSPTVDLVQHTLQVVQPEPQFGMPNEALNTTLTVNVLLEGQIDTGYSAFVGLASASGDPPGIPPAILGTPSGGSQPAVQGVATFPNFVINRVGQFRVQVVDTSQDPPVAVGPITIVPHNLQFTTQPAEVGVAGQPLPTVAVQVQTNPGKQPDNQFDGAVQVILGDAKGNPIPAGGPTLQNGVINLPSGQSTATFSNLIVSDPGTYTLIATCPGATTSVGGPPTFPEGQMVVSQPFAVGSAAANGGGKNVVANGTPGINNVLNIGAGSGGDDSLAYSLNGGQPDNESGVNTFTYTGGGADSMTVNVPPNGTLASGGMFLNGGPGSGSLTVDANGQLVATAPGSITVGDPQSIFYTSVRTVNIQGALAVGALPAPDTADRAAALAGLSGNARFIELLYLDDLGRRGNTSNASDAGGWIAALNAGLLSRSTAARDIVSSFESLDHLVKTWYQTYLGRPAQGGEEIGWVALLEGKSSQEGVLGAILDSPEFFARAQTLVDTGSAQQRYVEALYRVLLSRTAAPTETAGWLTFLPGSELSRLPLDLLSSTEFRIDQFEGYYNSLLHRPGDVGLNHWALSSLDMKNVLLGFEASTEFYQNG